MLALYGHPFSSYTWKALIALYANGTPFDFRTMGPDAPEHGRFVAAAHPAGKFPVLVDEAEVIVEAGAIVEWLALHHPGPAPLIPADPHAAAGLRMLDRVFDRYVMEAMQRVVNAHLHDPERPDPVEIAGGQASLRLAYDWLEHWLASHSLPAHVSLASCAAAPSLFYADWVEPIGGGRPLLAGLRAELLALPPVARCVEEARPWRRHFPPGAPNRD